MSFTVPDDVLNEIAEQLTKRRPPSAANEDLRDAWFGIDELSVGPAGARFNGWFTYLGGTPKMRITLDEVTAQRGTAAATLLPPVIVRIPPPEKLPSHLKFNSGGFLVAGALAMTGVGDFMLASISPWDWHLEGTVKLEKIEA